MCRGTSFKLVCDNCSGCQADEIVVLTLLLGCGSVNFEMKYDSTAAPAVPWPPSVDTSIRLCVCAVLLHPFIPRICDVSLWTTSSHFLLVFQLVLCYEISN